MKFYVTQETYNKLSKKIEDLEKLIFKAENNPASGNIYQIEYWETQIQVYTETQKKCIVADMDEVKQLLTNITEWESYKEHPIGMQAKEALKILTQNNKKC